MTRQKKTLQEIRDIIDCEGLGYSIQHYMDYSSIEDEYLQLKWKECDKLLNEIERYIFDRTEGE